MCIGVTLFLRLSETIHKIVRRLVGNVRQDSVHKRLVSLQLMLDCVPANKSPLNVFIIAINIYLGHAYLQILLMTCFSTKSTFDMLIYNTPGTRGWSRLRDQTLAV